MNKLGEIRLSLTAELISYSLTRIIERRIQWVREKKEGKKKERNR